MNCGIPYCHNGCPVNNLIPDWNHLVYEATGRTRSKPAFDQQLPRVHRPHLPRPVRGELHAQHRRRAGDHQVDRVRDRRPRMEGRLDRARSARSSAPASASRWSAPARRASPARSSWRAPAIGDGVREVRPGRRAAALRHSRLQDGEAPDQPPRGADGGRRRDLPHQHRGRRRRLVRQPAGEFRRGGAGRRRRGAAPADDPRRRAARACGWRWNS